MLKTKKQYPEYKWVYSKLLQSVLSKLDANYKSFFSLRKNGNETARPTKFRGEDYFFTMTYKQSGFEITDSKSYKIPITVSILPIIYMVKMTRVY